MGSASAASRQDPQARQVARPRAARVLSSVVLIVVLLGALAIRVDFTYNAYYFKDDHGTAALMSWHISQGREFPLYFYGWPYISAIGAYVGAAMFVVFGVSETSLCLAMTLFTLLWVLATYLLFSRLVGRWGGIIAAALVAFAPYTVMWYSVVPLLGYPPTLAFGTLILYVGVRLNERELSARAEWGCLVGMGALAGLAIWTNPLCAAYLVVGFGLLVAHVVRSRPKGPLVRKLAVASLVLLVALLPVFVTALKQGLHALFGFRSPRLSLVPQNFELVSGYYIKAMLLKGLHIQGLARWLLKAVYAILAAVFLVGFVVGIIKKNRRVIWAALVPVLFLLAAAFFFLPSPMASTYAPRYFMPFYLGVCAVFAFPLVLRRAWATAPTVMLALAVMAFNIGANIDAAHGRNAGAGARRMAEMQALVRDVEAAGLRHVMIDTLEGQTLTFVARERVIFAHTFQERYYPYAVGAAADDSTAISKDLSEEQMFKDTLGALGVTAAEPIEGAGLAVFYDFELPTRALRVVRPESVSLAGSPAGASDGHGLIDENDETMVGDRFDGERSLIVDFGQEVSLCGARFVAPREQDYPAGYTFSGSTDGEEWVEIQRVTRRSTLTCIYGNRLYNRGHLVPMECRFEPTHLRYLKIHGWRTTAPHHEVWRFQEAYFYTAAGEGTLPDEAEAVEIARELARRGVELAVCDEWLSRKIERLSGPRPDVLPHYEGLKRTSHVSRVLPVREGVAVVVEAAHADQCRDVLRRATLDEVTVTPITFPHYTAFVIERAPAAWRGFPGLKWNGFTLLGTARVATAAWYQTRGEALERTGRHDEAMRRFERAFETFPDLCANLETLAVRSEKAAVRMQLLTPEHSTPCRFWPSIRLLGYTLIPSTLVPGETATLRLVWALDGEVPCEAMSVFVHFLDVDGRRETIRFQADHSAKFPTAPGSKVPRYLVLDEHKFTVPAGCEAGRLTIRLGALLWSNHRKRLVPRTELPTRDRAVEVGVVEVVPSSGPAGASSM